MKIGIGFSKLKTSEGALQEAYRKSLQKLGATRASLVFIFYSYDYTLDAPAFAGALKKVLRDVPHMGSSSWSAWSQKETFEGETGLMVVSFHDLPFTFDFLRVHSLREKAELWSAEIARQLGDRAVSQKEKSDFLFLAADSLNFSGGSGFTFLERHFPDLQVFGFGTSFSVPQTSLVCNGEVYTNALIGLVAEGAKPWIGLLQNVRPEQNPIAVNRMSENLIIELDGKPAFYRLCEHLMTEDDLPMMSPDEFRKHMGNLYIVEKTQQPTDRPRVIGEPYRIVSLLGSEMTTGMVAVANALDFSQTHYLGQKKTAYAHSQSVQVLEELKKKIPKPSMLWMLVSSTRFRDKDRAKTDFETVSEVFPDTPVMGLATNGEFLGGTNQYASIVIVFSD